MSESDKIEAVTVTARCSFCGKAKDAVRRLVTNAAETVRICNECVEHSAKTIERADWEDAPPLSEDLEELLSATLDAYCEGSRRAEGALRERLYDIEADSVRLDWIEEHGLPDEKVHDGASLRQAIDAAKGSTTPADGTTETTGHASGDPK